jgi:hypothetical protein
MALTLASEWSGDFRAVRHLEQINAESGHYGPHPSITSLVRSYLVADLIRRVR